jgi:hypothetical protein
LRVRQSQERASCAISIAVTAASYPLLPCPSRHGERLLYRVRGEDAKRDGQPCSAMIRPTPRVTSAQM